MVDLVDVHRQKYFYQCTTPIWCKSLMWKTFMNKNFQSLTPLATVHLTKKTYWKLYNKDLQVILSLLYNYKTSAMLSTKMIISILRSKLCEHSIIFSYLPIMAYEMIVQWTNVYEINEQNKLSNAFFIRHGMMDTPAI